MKTFYALVALAIAAVFLIGAGTISPIFDGRGFVTGPYGRYVGNASGLTNANPTTLLTSGNPSVNSVLTNKIGGPAGWLPVSALANAGAFWVEKTDATTTWTNLTGGIMALSGGVYIWGPSGAGGKTLIEDGGVSYFSDGLYVDQRDAASTYFIGKVSPGTSTGDFNLRNGAVNNLNASGTLAGNLIGVQTGVHATPSTSNPLSPTWSSTVETVWYGATGTINLPSASGYTGRGIIIYNTGAFTITVDPNSSEVIVRDGTVQTGGVSMTLSTGAGNYVALICDGARWITLGFKGTLAAGS